MHKYYKVRAKLADLRVLLKGGEPKVYGQFDSGFERFESNILRRYSYKVYYRYLSVALGLLNGKKLEDMENKVAPGNELDESVLKRTMLEIKVSANEPRFPTIKKALNELASSIHKKKKLLHKGLSKSSDAYTLIRDLREERFQARHLLLAYHQLKGGKKYPEPTYRVEPDKDYVHDLIKAEAREKTRRRADTKLNKLYVLIRGDLSVGQQAVQAGHAVAAYLDSVRALSPGYRYAWNNGTLVYLEVKDLKDLKYWRRYLKERSTHHAVFHEPYISEDTTLSFLVFEDDEPSFRRRVKRLKLAFY